MAKYRHLFVGFLYKLLTLVYRNHNIVISIQDLKSLDRYSRFMVGDKNLGLAFSFLLSTDLINSLDKEDCSLSKELYIKHLNDYFEKKKKMDKLSEVL